MKIRCVAGSPEIYWARRPPRDGRGRRRQTSKGLMHSVSGNTVLPTPRVNQGQERTIIMLYIYISDVWRPDYCQRSYQGGTHMGSYAKSYQGGTRTSMYVNSYLWKLLCIYIYIYNISFYVYENTVNYMYSNGWEQPNGYKYYCAQGQLKTNFAAIWRRPHPSRWWRTARPLLMPRRSPKEVSLLWRRCKVPHTGRTLTNNYGGRTHFPHNHRLLEWSSRFSDAFMRNRYMIRAM